MKSNILNGKCLEDFSRYIFGDYALDISGVYITSEVLFSQLPLEMVWGVYQEFFLENKMFIYPKQLNNGYSLYIDWKLSHLLVEYVYVDDLREARLRLIELANEMYNKKNFLNEITD